MRFKKINIEPWNVSLQDRLDILLCDNKKKIVYIYEKADTSTFRYRVYNMCQALNHSNQWLGVYFFENEIDTLIKHLASIDIVVFVRVRWSEKNDYLLQRIRKNNIPIYFDIDDLVFNVEKIPLITGTLNVDMQHPDSYSYWFSYVSRLWLMGKLCDGYITTNNFLMEKLFSIFGKKVYVLKNFLNDEQIDISENLLSDKYFWQDKNYFEIGYFSGTPSHINDFKVVAPEIKSFLDKYHKARLKIVGFMDFPPYLHDYIKSKRIIHRSLVDFLTLQKEIHRSDVNIIPLIDNEFTNCKSELKYFEAAIVGTISCATPTYVFKNNIRNDVNGFLCEQGEWFGILERMYKKDFDYESFSKNARQYCLENYSSKNQKTDIENVCESIINTT